MICSNCGKEIKDSACFCMFCGKKIEEKREAETITNMEEKTDNKKGEESDLSRKETLQVLETISAKPKRRRVKLLIAFALLLTIAFIIMVENNWIPSKSFNEKESSTINEETTQGAITNNIVVAIRKGYLIEGGNLDGTDYLVGKSFNDHFEKRKWGKSTYNNQDCVKFDGIKNGNEYTIYFSAELKNGRSMPLAFYKNKQEESTEGMENLIYEILQETYGVGTIINYYGSSITYETEPGLDEVVERVKNSHYADNDVYVSEGKIGDAFDSYFSNQEWGLDMYSDETTLYQECIYFKGTGKYEDETTYNIEIWISNPEEELGRDEVNFLKLILDGEEKDYIYIENFSEMLFPELAVWHNENY